VTAFESARRFGLRLEPALGFVVGAAFFALVAIVLVAVDSELGVIAFGAVCLAAVIAIARSWGVAYAVPVAMAGYLGYDWFEFPPTHPAEFPDRGDLAGLVVYLASSVLIGELAAQAARRAEASEAARGALADEQGALRRVATMVAREAPPEEVLTAVAHEAGDLLAVDAVHFGRYEPDGTAVGVASWSRAGDHLPVGTRASAEGDDVTGAVLRTGRPARMDSYEEAKGPIAQRLRELGFRSSVGSPIVVGERLWGVMVVSSKAAWPLAPDTESRIAHFTELAATAIANVRARCEMQRLADEQAALRRVATLVARDCPPPEVFSAVAEEVGSLLRVEGARIWRYENEQTATAVAAWGRLAPGGLVAAITLREDSIAGRVLRTRRPARVDDYERAGAGEAGARAGGIRAAVGTPIVVDGRLWGAMVIATTRDAPLPPDTEEHVGQFAELVATAISNVQARSDLAASRARLMAAADEERRRVVRDLHDGAQQRLVHTVITLKLARQALGEQDDRSSALVNEALDQAQQAMAELRELAHGILPSALTHGGLRAGIGELGSRMPVPVEIDVPVDRLARPIEATAYFVVAEALTNVAKHSSADRAEVTVRVEEGTLRVDVRDDGRGGARTDGSGLLGLADRLAVLDGRLEVDSPPGHGTHVGVVIPLAPVEGAVELTGP